MATRIPVTHDNNLIYNILIERDFNELDRELQTFSLENKKVCIVSDQNVASLYIDEIKHVLRKHTSQVINYIFLAGESNKNLNTVYDLYELLIKSKFDRNDLLIALGGGVVGDLTGFTAATYLRGIKYIQIPTSLLAQVDSSIGGKTGVDFNQYKNMVGAFYHPALVYINIDTLTTLPEREYLSGMAEVIKHGLIKDKSYYHWLQANTEAIKALDLEVLHHMVKWSCLIKKNVVEHDFKEKGDRALLNFGHTIGHAIEKLKNFTLFHGECVSIGMAYATKLSYCNNHISDVEKSDVLKLLSEFNLPIEFTDLQVCDIMDTLKLDKKMESGILKFILLKEIGNAYIDTSIPLKVIEEILKKEPSN